MNLKCLVEMSNRYGSDEEFVLAGGGNTSYKENGILYVKGSGVQLSDIKAEQFVVMDIGKLLNMVNCEYPDSMNDAEKDAKALADMMAARLPGEESKRPSVEASLHAIFPYKYVLHLHPALINGLTCGNDGKVVCEDLFGDEAVWIDLSKPGLILSQVCSKAFDAYTEKNGKYPQTVILQNHGIFIAADTVDEIDRLMDNAVKAIRKCVNKTPDFKDIAFKYDMSSMQTMKDTLKAVYSENGNDSAVVLFYTNNIVDEFVSDEESFSPLSKPFTPDHIVYCKDEPLFIEPDVDFTVEVKSYYDRKGYKPNIIAVRGVGFFAPGIDMKKATQAKMLFLDAIKIAVYTESFGGANPLDEEYTDFILNWEAEAYRAKA